MGLDLYPFINHGFDSGSGSDLERVLLVLDLVPMGKPEFCFETRHT